MAIAVSALVLAFLISYGLTPLIRDLAVRFDFVDRPDGQRKIQAKPVSLGGGISLLIVTPIVVWLIGMWWGPDLWHTTLDARVADRSGRGGAGLRCCRGLSMTVAESAAATSLLWQVLAACLVMGAGFRIPSVQLFDVRIPLGILGSAFTVIWLLGPSTRST